MQLRKIRWSDFRNSHACCMQISDAAGHYTQKLLHRRASPPTICSLSCSCSWGGLITDLEPLLLVQHASLDTLVSNLSNCFLGCFLLFLTETGVVVTLLPPVGRAPKPNCGGVVPHARFPLLHVHTVELSHLLVTI